MEADEDQRPIKVILVGSSGVGKTSLINAYFDQPHETDTSPTVAPAFVATTIKLANWKPVELHIWDTAGQERFQSIGGMFYRDSDVAFVCFDRAAIPTIPEWVARVRKQVADCIIFLVATKQDLIPDNEIDGFRQLGDQLVQQNGAKLFFVTSSARGSGVKELFTEAAKCSEIVCAPATPATVQVGQPAKKVKKEKCEC
jgi:small GTP-binding protein